MFEKFIRNKMIKLLHEEDVKKFLKDEIDKKSELTLNTLNSLLIEFKQKVTDDLNKMKEMIDECQSDNIEKIDILREDLDSQIEILHGTISNNLTQTRKLFNLVNRFEVIEQQVKLLLTNDQLTKIKQQIDSQVSNLHKKVDDVNRQTRFDTAAVVKKVKADVSNLEIRLEAFIDTISEKLAE